MVSVKTETAVKNGLKCKVSEVLGQGGAGEPNLPCLTHQLNSKFNLKYKDNKQNRVELTSTMMTSMKTESAAVSIRTLSQSERT